MRPEFLDRIDELVMFRPLTAEHLEGIIHIQLRQLERVLQKQNITFGITDDLVKYLKQEGYDLQYGARPLKRLIQKKILDELSVAMLKGTVQTGSHIRMDVRDQHVVFLPESKLEDAALL